jgi:hypothetical protein
MFLVRYLVKHVVKYLVKYKQYFIEGVLNKDCNQLAHKL